MPSSSPSFSSSSTTTTKKEAMSSSSHSSIKILVCTANLGNAKPDAHSWDAWIPKNGRIPLSAVAVRMTPPERKQQRPKMNGQEILTSKTNTTTSTPAAPCNSTSNNPRARKQRSSQEASAFSLNRNKQQMGTSSSSPSSTSSSIPKRNRSDPNIILPVIIKPTPTPTPKQQEDSVDDEYERWLEKQQQQQQQQQRQTQTPANSSEVHVVVDDDDDDFNWVPPLTPTGKASTSSSTTAVAAVAKQVSPSPFSHDDNNSRDHPLSQSRSRTESEDSYEKFLQHLQTHLQLEHDPSKTKKTETPHPQQHQEEEDEEDENQYTQSLLDEHSFPAFFAFDEANLSNSNGFAFASTSIDEADVDADADDEQEAPGEERFSLAPPRRNYSHPKVQPLPTSLSSQMPPPAAENKDDSNKPLLRGRKNGSQKDQHRRKSTSKSKSRSPSRSNLKKKKTTDNSCTEKVNEEEEDYFDLIVIGMQEATFDIHKSKNKKKKKSKDNEQQQQQQQQHTTLKHSKSDPTPSKPKSQMMKKKKKASSSSNGKPESTTKILQNTSILNDDSYNNTTTNNKRVSSSSSSQHSLSTGGDADWDDDDDSLSSSDDEEMCILHDDGTVTIVDDYTKLIPMDNNNNNNSNNNDKEKTTTTSKGLKKLLAKGTTTTAKTLVKVGYKAGRVGLQAGKAGYLVSKKVGKAADMANRYAGYGKDHTLRPVPTAVRVSSNATTLDDKSGGWTDSDTIHYRLEAEQIPGYRRALSYQFGEMRLMVYVRLFSVGRKKAAIKSIDIESVKYQATGIGGVLANKGGIVAEVLVNHTTRLSFLSAHLEAHEGESHFNARCTSFQDILSGAGHKFYDASQSSHYSFVMGDLNFRTRLTGVNPERHLQMTHKMAANKDWRILNQYDELQMALSIKKCLVGYQTPYCNFAPTFKVARQNGHHYNIKRSPSYTDRILFKSADQLDNLVPFLYEGVERFVSSDHKPIRSAFEIPLNPSLKWKPAAPAKGMEASGDKKTKCDKSKKLTATRETMHFFVSDIRCVIYPSEYDKLKRTEKADTPNPVLLFVTNPNSAITKDDAASKKKIWNKLGLNSNSKSSKKASANTPTDASSKYPATSVQKDTLRPDWGKESVHFTVSTHKNSGEPVFLSASMLHFCLRDSKQAFLIGSYALNLAQLIAISRQNIPINAPANSNSGRRSSAESSEASNRRGSSGGFNLLAAPSTALLTAGVGATNEHVQRASLTLNPKQGYNNANSLLPTSTVAAKSFEQTLNRKGSVRHMGRGPSKSLVSAMINDGNTSNEKQGREKLMGLNLMSLRLDETLIGGGLEIGLLKCTIDIWWTQDDE